MLKKKEADASPLQRFFRVLLPGFSNKLLLPRIFAKQLMNERCRKRKATLTNPNGSSWRVDVHKDLEKDTMHFGGDGWEKFIQEHDLRLGFFLVFCYESDMVFNFRAYDTSTCEMVYPSIAQLQEKMKRVAHTKKDLGYHKSSISSKRSTPRHTKYSLDCTKSNLSKSYVNIPMRVMRECRQLSQQNELILIAPTGRKWLVRLCHRTKPCNRTHISKGWQEFARGNKLKVDDTCVFELLSNKMMKVRITRKRWGS